LLQQDDDDDNIFSGVCDCCSGLLFKFINLAREDGTNPYKYSLARIHRIPNKSSGTTFILINLLGQQQEQIVINERVKKKKSVDGT
jgi:hypothetical protein